MPSLATLELYWNKDIKVAMNVFEFGLKAFGDNAEYVIQYLDFLIKSNNDSSAFSSISLHLRFFHIAQPSDHCGSST